VLFASLAILIATGCYKKESPEDDSSEGGTIADGSATDVGSDGGSEGAGSATNNPTQDGSAEGSDPDETGNDSNDDGPDTGADGAELEPLIGSLCDWEFKCCSDGERDYRLGPFTTDAANCSERFVEQLYSNDDKPELARGDLLYTLGFGVRLDRSTPNAEAAAECRDLIEQQQCWEPWEAGGYCTPASGDPGSNPCDLRNLFTGNQAVGEPCSEALALIGYDIECEAGSTCEEKDGVYTCVDKGLVDEFCEADDKCDQGLFCDIAAGRCALRADEGDHCEFQNVDEPDLGTETLPCLEHLTCDPESETCVSYCNTNYDCADDSACPEDESCIPVDKGDNTYTYCRERGDTNGDRCDSDRDCVDDMHCTAGSCRSDDGMGDDCAAENECEGGLYCDIGGTGQCEIVVNANEACNADRECNPSTTMGCVTSDDGRVCRTGLLANGDVCAPGERNGANWCASGICEDVSEDGIVNPECELGASENEECDEDDGTDDVGRCQRGLYCFEGQCKLKSDAGGSCADDGALECNSGACDQIWEGDYCTDAVPVGATDVVTCDGED
jgi:hypothetical protein